MKRKLMAIMCTILIVGTISGFGGYLSICNSFVVKATVAQTVFSSFDDASTAVSVIDQIDLSPFGVTSSLLSLALDNTDIGKGLKVSLNKDSSQFCQLLVYKDTLATTSAFVNASQYQYLRLWVHNPDAEIIGVSAQLSKGLNKAIINSDDALLIRCDGETIETQTADYSGEGKYHVMIPGGFTGWVAWPLTSKLEIKGSSPQMSSYEETTGFSLDIRPQTSGSSNYYVLDNFALATEASGQKRNYIDPMTALLNEKKIELGNMINGFLNVNPQITEISQYNPDSNPNSSINDWSGIKAITYDGATINGAKTKIFAYIGYPQNASASSKVPAVVLIHGGGGYAYAEWVRIWNNKGYAAIAIDTTGCFPSSIGKGIAGRESDSASYWQFGLYGDFAQSGYVNAPANDGMNSSGNAIDTQWMYHAVVQSILAHNILINDVRVDNSKIGITGISWGGVINSIAIGYDTRYAFAIPVYGAGYLDQGLSYMKNYFGQIATKTLWSAADQFSKITFPVLWLGWTNDPNFSIQSNSLSYEATKDEGSILSMQMNIDHSHANGWNPTENYRFADSIVKDGQPLTMCATEPDESRNISFTINKPTDATSVSAKAYYLTTKMTYSLNGLLTTPGYYLPTMDQTWSSVDCTVNGNTIIGTLPTNAHSYYVKITTETPGGNYVTSTRYIEIDNTIITSSSQQSSLISSVADSSSSSQNTSSLQSDSISQDNSSLQGSSVSQDSSTSNQIPKNGDESSNILLMGLLLLLSAYFMFVIAKSRKGFNM